MRYIDDIICLRDTCVPVFQGFAEMTDLLTIENQNRKPPRMKGERVKRRRTKKMIEQDGKCYWCGIDMTPAKRPGDGNPTATAVTIDHLLPLWKGGNNSRENTVAACYKCNGERDRADKPFQRNGLRHQPNEVRFDSRCKQSGLDGKYDELSAMLQAA